MKYVFLDIDGVLNRYPHDPDEYAIIENDLLELFSKFIHETDVRIILSSDWKRDFNDNLQPYEEYSKIEFDNGAREVLSLGTTLLLAFEDYDLKIYDKTPNAPSSTRYDWYNWHEDEIKWYIKEHLTSEGRYVIFDDADLRCNEFGENFIQTKYTEGLRAKDIEKAKEILNN